MYSYTPFFDFYMVGYGCAIISLLGGLYYVRSAPKTNQYTYRYIAGSIMLLFVNLNWNMGNVSADILDAFFN